MGFSVCRPVIRASTSYDCDGCYDYGGLREIRRGKPYVYCFGSAHGEKPWPMRVCISCAFDFTGDMPEAAALALLKFAEVSS